MGVYPHEIVVSNLRPKWLRIGSDSKNTAATRRPEFACVLNLFSVLLPATRPAFFSGGAVAGGVAEPRVFRGLSALAVFADGRVHKCEHLSFPPATATTSVVVVQLAVLLEIPPDAVLAVRILFRRSGAATVAFAFSFHDYLRFLLRLLLFFLKLVLCRLLYFLKFFRTRYLVLRRRGFILGIRPCLPITTGVDPLMSYVIFVSPS